MGARESVRPEVRDRSKWLGAAALNAEL